MTFRERTRLLLVINGSKPVLPKLKGSPWLLSFPRVLEAMSSNHHADAELTVRNRRLATVRALACASRL